MSGIVGVFNRTGAAVERRTLELMLAARPERGPDGISTRVDGSVGMGFRHFCLLPEEREEHQPLTLEDLSFAGDCRLDNRPELARLLGLDVEQAAALSDAMLILLAYRVWGERCPERLLGDFAFIVWDSRRRQLFAARDAMGARGLCYYINGTICLLASEISQILACPTVQPQINDDRVAAFLTGIWDKQEESFYRDIHYLPPAHALSVTADRVELRAYWEVRPQSIRYREEREYAEHYRELLIEAVACRLRSFGPVGISLSGGLDSSTIAALAAPGLSAVTGQARLKSFSYAFDELENCDERAYIQPVVERYGLDATYISCDERWTLKDFRDLPATPDFVMADAYVWLPISVMEAAEKAGVRLLLGGYYGDVLMTGQHYWALDMFRGRQIGMLGRTIRANYRSFRWQNGFVEYGLRRLIPPEMAHAYRRARPRRAAVIAPGIHKDLTSRTDLRSRLSPEPPLSALRAPGLSQRYQSMMSSAFSQGYAATRYLYNRYGLELALPYYDRRLVEFVLALPAYVLGRPGSDRRLHREAMLGLLPEEVRLRQQPTSFVPLLMKGLREKEKDTMRQIMAKPQIVERGYIRSDWLETQLQREYDMSPDSLLLWLSLSLELWLQRYWT